ncbi:MBL fold metallo-hydrolase [Chryseobacterium sp. BIGb0232]|uniref:MBL fold metallo-hydrolase n=1 Tax=Chryseobacterium sp. BIGb0232 TaxID=2940598 RepID=UPI000F4A61A3|nr:MBL fold metallo-hydrolase [Chryseobacterium sp. BIGb0232]MCS4300750.1 glyoxylase-like metal-dependent hydrolase (beta-lactamase superfamily II) [Chryseobacterium sp. BIGb0232]ROS20370.1 glyoxylase-like metal-dependent hydrolase (beta-lactamase superfamily II) [Chryseobacterium nakagawai]
MNRRELLKSGLLAGTLSLVPFSSVWAGTKIIPEKAGDDLSGFKKIKLGELELFILTDGYIHEENLNSFSPRGNISELKTILKDNFRADNYIDMAVNILLVKTKEKLILMDTGMGIFADERTGFLLKSLQKTGFSANDVTDIFLSHAHPDHMGGVVDKQNKLVFPNAAIFISKIEHDFWMNASIKDFNNSALKEHPEMLNQIIPALQNILKVIQPKLKFYDLNKTLYNHFNFQIAPGHTPGLTVTTILSGNEKLMYVADLIHSDIILFPHPDWGFSGDTDLDIATASRKKFLRQLADTGIRAFASHLPWPGLGFTKIKAPGFEWIPESFTN